MYKIFYMCVSYDLKVSNEDFCCWGKIVAIFLSNGTLFCACISRYKHELVMGELEAVSKELIKEKFLLVATCCTRSFFYA